MNRIISVVFLLTCSFLLRAQSWTDTTAQIEKIFSRYAADRPGTELAIMRNGKIIFSKAWGMADLEHDVKLSTISPTEAGSVSKQFTSAAILLLEQQGKLSVNDDIRKYLPEVPDYGHPILIRHLMEHTSGLKDWGSVAEVAGWPRSTKTYSNADALYIVSRQKTLNNIPGAEYIYSNSNYNLLAIIVDRLSGMTMAEFTRKYIFEPAGMKHTEWRDDFKRIVPNRAIAYSWNQKGYQTNMPNEYVYGNGGLLTTAEDLLLWNDYYGNGRLGNPSILKSQTTPYPFNNGTPHNYAAGLVIGSYKGWKTISHTGATASYRSSLEFYPELGLSIAWLSNTSQFDGAPLYVPGAVAELMVGQKGELAKKEEVKPAITSETALTNFAGWYRNERSGAGMNMIVKDGKLLIAPSTAVTVTGDRSFLIGDTRFEVNGDWKKGLRRISASRDTALFTKATPAVADSVALLAYLGKYYSAEADATYELILKGGKLTMHMQPEDWYTLDPTYKDAFDFDQGNLYFTRNKKNAVTGFMVSVSRARNIWFEKVSR